MPDLKKLESLAFRLVDLPSLRKLVVEGLQFEFTDKPVSKQNWTDDEKEIVVESKIIAEKNDFFIYYIQTNTDSLKHWKGIAGKIIKEKNGFCLVCSHNPSGFKWVFSSLSKEFSRSFSETRHVPIEIRPSVGVPSNFVEFLGKLKVGGDSTATSIASQVSEAFDTFAVEIHNELTVNVFEALKTLSDGIIGDKNNKLSLSDETLNKIREPIFTLLYRIIFILYAEDRGIFPVDNPIYYEKFSLKWIKEEWLLKKTNTKLADYEVQKRLKNLFRLIEVGSEELDYDKEKFFMRSYYGRLFDRKINYKIEQLNIPNSKLLATLNLLNTTTDKKGNHFFLDYSALEIRHLGEIYEHLLEFHLQIQNNTIANLPDPNDRKSSGSYYTPKQLVNFIVKNSIEPHIAKIIKDNDDANEIIEKILSLKILDPAMGSGHFLIGATDYLAKRICELEENQNESNYIERKREVVRRCIYGVDLNPLAVDLAKLSLWLDTISSERPLAFLSAHLKCGDALIGLQINDIFEKQTTLFESSQGRIKLKKSIKEFLMLENLADDSPNAVRLKIEKYNSMQSQNSFNYKLRFLLGYKLASQFGYEINPIGSYMTEIGEESIDFYVNDDGKLVKNLIDFRKFLHWELEFPEIFFDENAIPKTDAGFDIILGNPPWDVLKPSIEDFFSTYYQSETNKSFRKASKQEKNKFIKKLLEQNPNIQKSLEQYKDDIYKYSDYLVALNFYDDEGIDGKVKRRETNLYKLFLKRIILLLLKKNGSCGIVIPANFYIDLNNKTLRELLFTNCNVDSLYQFDNTKNMFPAIDSRTKIISLIFSKHSSTKSFKAMFYQNDISKLEKINDEAINYDMEIIKKVSPDSLSLIEYQNDKEIEIIKKLYEFPIISKNPKFYFETKHGDFHTTKDAPLFNTKKLGRPVFQGGMIHQFTHQFSDPKYWIDPDKAIKFLRSKKSKTNSKIPLDVEFPRIVWRNIARGTDMRTLICAIIPPKNFVTNSINYVKPLINNKKVYSTKKLFFLCGILNSFFIDFIIRRRIDKIVAGYFLHELPIPDFNEKQKSHYDVVNLVCSLVCTTQEFDDIRKELKVKQIISSIEDRENVIAKLNITIAKIFNLTKADIEYILSTFPNPKNNSLKKKIIESI